MTNFDCRAGKNGEVQLADGIKALLSKQRVYATFFDGVRYDGGDKLAWLESNVKLALQSPELRDEFGAFLKNLLNSSNKLR